MLSIINKLMQNLYKRNAPSDKELHILYKKQYNKNNIIPFHLDNDLKSIRLVTQEDIEYGRCNLIIHKAFKTIIDFCNERNINFVILNNKSNIDLFIEATTTKKHKFYKKHVFIFYTLFVEYEISLNIVRCIDNNFPTNIDSLIKTFFIYYNGRFYSMSYYSISLSVLDNILL